ncbi:MAG: translation elongation factor Ts [Clostridia bacterium]
MAFTSKDVMDLRGRTGAGMMDCKKALVETDGDMEKAIVFLREKGIANAAKKAGRIASQGIVESYIHMGGKIGVLVEMSANASDELTHDVALQIAASNPLYVKSEDVPNEDVEKEKEILRVQAQAEEKPKPAAIVEKMIDGRIAKFYKEICLIEQPFVKDGDKSVKAILKEGGNVEVFKFSRFTMGEGLEKKSEDLSKEVEEQIANMKK